MSQFVSGRMARGKFEPNADSPPPLLTILVARPGGPDGASIVLRDSFESEVSRAIRFALSALRGAVERHGGPLDSWVLTERNVPLFHARQEGNR